MPYHILPAFRARVVRRGRQDHWQGGPAYHRGANCPACNRPLLLLWDLNCADPRFVVKGRPVFKRLERLPLFYCMGCWSEMDYRVVASNQIDVLRNSGQPQGLPYAKYPKELPRRPLELDPLRAWPERIKKIVTTKAMYEDLSLSERTVLTKWLGRPTNHAIDIWWHEFGGLPWLVQGQEYHSCPNPDCGWARRQWPMKVLAKICDDPPGGLPLTQPQPKSPGEDNSNPFCQFIYHICKGCLTIHVGNRVD